MPPNIILRVEDTLICSGIEPMLVAEGGAHVRTAVIRVPATFADRPTVSATVRATTLPAAVGIVFGVYNIKVDELGPADTQVLIEAANVTKQALV